MNGAGVQQGGDHSPLQIRSNDIKTCCCCFNLRGGVMFIAVIELGISLWFLAVTEELVLAAGVFSFLASIAGFYGAMKLKPTLTKFYYYWLCIIVIIIFAFLVRNIIMVKKVVEQSGITECKARTDDCIRSFSILYWGMLVTDVSIGGYFIWVTRSCYHLFFDNPKESLWSYGYCYDGRPAIIINSPPGHSQNISPVPAQPPAQPVSNSMNGVGGDGEPNGLQWMPNYVQPQHPAAAPMQIDGHPRGPMGQVVQPQFPVGQVDPLVHQYDQPQPMSDVEMMQFQYQQQPMIGPNDQIQPQGPYPIVDGVPEPIADGPQGQDIDGPPQGPLMVGEQVSGPGQQDGGPSPFNDEHAVHMAAHMKSPSDRQRSSEHIYASVEPRGYGGPGGIGGEEQGGFAPMGQPQMMVDEYGNVMHVFHQPAPQQRSLYNQHSRLPSSKQLLDQENAQQEQQQRQGADDDENSRSAQLQQLEEEDSRTRDARNSFDNEQSFSANVGGGGGDVRRLSSDEG